MTLRESMQLYCNQHEDCCLCPLVSACKRNLGDDDDPYAVVSDMSEDDFTAFVYESRVIAEQIMYYINPGRQIKIPARPRGEEMLEMIYGKSKND